MRQQKQVSKMEKDAGYRREVKKSVTDQSTASPSAANSSVSKAVVVAHTVEVTNHDQFEVIPECIMAIQEGPMFSKYFPSNTDGMMSGSTELSGPSDKKE